MMASSLAAVAMLFLTGTFVLNVAQARVDEEVATTIELRDDQAPRLNTEEMMSARDRMVNAGLRSIRTRSFFTDDAGHKMIRTQYRLAGSTSRDRIVEHAHLLHKAFPKIFTEADVQELESIVERSEEDSELANALRNRPYITIVFSQIYRADESIEERKRQNTDDAEDWQTQISVDHETGRANSDVCLGIRFRKTLSSA